MVNTEANISIILPTLFEDCQNEEQILDKIRKRCGNPFTYVVPFKDSNEFATLVSDRELTPHLVLRFYNEIMNYHQAVDEELLDEEYEIRDQEVKEKWFNGNFNYWILEEENTCQCECCKEE